MFSAFSYRKNIFYHYYRYLWVNLRFYTSFVLYGYTF